MPELPDFLAKNLQKQIRERGLGQFEANISRVAVLTILLRVELVANPQRLGLGCSKLGGTPDLPAGWKWAVVDENRSSGERQLISFIGQLNFAELPVLGQPLPRTGILYVFAGLDNADEDVHKLMYYDGPVDMLVRQPALDQRLYANEYDYTFGTLRISKFIPSVSLPSYACAEKPTIPDGHYEAYNDLAMQLEKDADQHEPSSRLLGYPIAYHGDPRPAADWQVLLSAESFFGPEGCVMNFGDAGTLQVLAPTAKLKNGDFGTSTLAGHSN